jgi:hypothetical protein
VVMLASTPSSTIAPISQPFSLRARRRARRPKEHGVARAAGMARHPAERQTAYGQMYLAPSGALKQPIDSGNSVFGSQSTALGKKIAKAIVTKKIT